MIASIAAGVLFLAALLLWLGLVANMSTMHNSDPAGRGMAQAYALFTILALYAVLAVLLSFAAWRGTLPSTGRWALWLLHPLSGAALIAALYLMEDRTVRWPLAIPCTAPLILMLAAVWSYLHWIPAPALWIVLSLVSLAPWPAVLARQTHRSERREAARQKIAQQAQEESEQRRTDTLARFQQLHTGSPLWDWMEFAAKDHELREQALQAIRQLPHRQDEAEAMLRRGLPFPLLELPHLDLAPTTELCAAATSFLTGHAQSMKPKVPDPPAFHLLAYRFEPFLPGLAWLHSRKCDLSETVQALQDSASAYPPSRERDAFLAALHRLR